MSSTAKREDAADGIQQLPSGPDSKRGNQRLVKGKAEMKRPRPCNARSRRFRLLAVFDDLASPMCHSLVTRHWPRLNVADL